MKILYTIRDLHIGGACNTIFNNVNGLIKKNYEPVVIFFNKNEEMKQRFVSIGVIPIFIPYNGWKTLIPCVIKLRRYMVKNKIEVVHSNLFLDKLLVSVATTGLTIRKIASVHGAIETIKDIDGRKKKIQNWISCFLLNHSFDTVIAVSEAAKKSAILTGIRENKIRIIYNGIPINFENTEKKISIENIVIGTIGRFDPVKGFPRLIDVFNDLQKQIPHLILVIVGNGREMSLVKTRIKDLQLEDRVILPGFINNPNEQLMKFDFYINSSYLESLGLGIIEAMNMGVPAICSKVGGIPEFICDYKNGILVDFGAPDIVTRIHSFLHFAQENYEELSINAKMTVQKKFSLDTNLCQLIEIYQK